MIWNGIAAVHVERAGRIEHELLVGLNAHYRRRCRCRCRVPALGWTIQREAQRRRSRLRSSTNRARSPKASRRVGSSRPKTRLLRFGIKVIPLYKKGDRYDLANFRPISINIVPGKLCEKCVSSQLSAYLSARIMYSVTTYTDFELTVPQKPRWLVL